MTTGPFASIKDIASRILAHKNDANAHHAQAHGATDHADVTRSIWIDRQDVQADGATATNSGSNPEAYPTFQLADAATQGVYTVRQLPRDAKTASPSSVILWWASSLNENGTAVRFSINAVALAVGSVVSGTGTTTAFTGTSANKSSQVLIGEIATQVLASSSPGDLIRLNVRRLGADALDTYTGTVRLVGIELQYTATQ